MSRFLSICLVASCGIVSVLAASPPQKISMAGDRANASKATIEGLVRDAACPIQNLDSTPTNLSMKCVRECVRGGSPLVILTNDGHLYFPISDKMPDKDQRQKLMPFVGEYVQASGTVFERTGAHAIVISEIKEMKEIHLKMDGN